ncbi:MAG TPA: hypothetical protein VEK35_11650 [Roseiarcus sp.]|nr:hypothetical protein [Roseiarcus sp.]
MGELVIFRRYSSAVSRSAAPPPPQGAEIVFFTGIRYDRGELTAANVETNGPPPEGGLNGAGGGRRKRRA